MHVHDFVAVAYAPRDPRHCTGGLRNCAGAVRQAPGSESPGFRGQHRGSTPARQGSPKRGVRNKNWSVETMTI
ncbi:unnamed protein product, partial [Iphiclides podalirius]